MADGTLYNTDFLAWTEQQAKLLREAAQTRDNLPFDWENLAEEIESLGISDSRALLNQMSLIAEHLLKLQYAPSEAPRPGWEDTVSRSRDEITLLLRDSPSLRRKFEPSLSPAMDIARKRAARSFSRYNQPAAVSAIGQHQNYTLDQILGDWFPDHPPPRG